MTERKSPEAFIVGGPNGAGKSTFVLGFLQEKNLPFVSADAIAKELNPEQPSMANVRAGRKYLRNIRDLIDNRTSFITESTLSGKTFRKVYERLQEQSYRIITIFLYVEDPDLCLDRIEERIRAGGHHVPEKDVRRRFDRSVYNFWNRYKTLSNQWILLYNGGKRPELVASGEPDSTEVLDNDRYQSFQSIVKTHG